MFAMHRTVLVPASFASSGEATVYLVPKIRSGIVWKPGKVRSERVLAWLDGHPSAHTFPYLLVKTARDVGKLDDKEV